MKLTTTKARLIVYLLGAGVGAAIILIGAVRGDAGLMAAGGALLGTNALAGANVPRGDDPDDEPIG